MYVARMGEITNAYTIFVAKANETDWVRKAQIGLAFKHSKERKMRCCTVIMKIAISWNMTSCGMFTAYRL